MTYETLLKFLTMNYDSFGKALGTRLYTVSKVVACLIRA